MVHLSLISVASALCPPVPTPRRTAVTAGLGSSQQSPRTRGDAGVILNPWWPLGCGLVLLLILILFAQFKITVGATLGKCFSSSDYASTRRIVTTEERRPARDYRLCSWVPSNPRRTEPGLAPCLCFLLGCLLKQNPLLRWMSRAGACHSPPHSPLKSQEPPEQPNCCLRSAVGGSPGS